MKKIFYFALIACLTGFVSACSDDGMDNPYRTDDALTVISNDVQIPSKGGSGSIVVDGNGTVTAESSIDWCSVSVNGNTVTFSAPANNSIESRNAFVTIKSGSKSTQVSVYQDGMVFVLDNHTFSVDDANNKLSTGVKLSNGDSAVTTNSLTSWITGQYNPSTKMVELNVEPNNSGLPRSGQLEVICNGYKEVITINQFDFAKDVLGEYYFVYSKNSNGTQWADLPAELTSNSIKLYLDEESPLVIPIKMPNGSNAPYDITVDFANYVGDYTLQGKTYNCYLGFDNYRYNFLSRYTSYFFAYLGATQANITLSMNTEDDGYVWFGGFGEGIVDLDGDEYGDISTWYILAMSQKEFAQANLVGSLLTMYWPYLEKVTYDEETGAKVAAKRSAPSRRSIK